MFSKRKTFSQHYKYDRKFLEAFASDLRKADFGIVSVKLPHNLIHQGEQTEISIEDFLARGRNYPSVIVLAKNKDKEEVIKVLLINISTKAFFVDDTFPSGHSESPELYVQSNDPGRVFSIFGFFYDYLKSGSSISPFLGWLFFLLSLMVMFSEFLSMSNSRLLLASYFNTNPILDFFIIILSFIGFFQFYSFDGGLYIKEKENKTLVSLKRIVKGEFRDNPIINLIVTVAAGVIVIFLSKLLL